MQHAHGKTLKSAAGPPARVQIPVPPSATSRLLYELLGRVRLGFLVVSPFRSACVFLHVEERTEALSEHGVVPEQFIFILWEPCVYMYVLHMRHFVPPLILCDCDIHGNVKHHRASCMQQVGSAGLLCGCLEGILAPWVGKSGAKKTS
jgi:hypothetical protein